MAAFTVLVINTAAMTAGAGVKPVEHWIEGPAARVAAEGWRKKTLTSGFGFVALLSGKLYAAARYSDVPVKATNKPPRPLRAFTILGPRFDVHQTFRTVVEAGDGAEALILATLKLEQDGQKGQAKPMWAFAGNIPIEVARESLPNWF